ncbi:MAG TPA: hypothetical protein VJS44_07450 [Pyrinomonadaceae bacterium]|nr:hypothetical protein [Pyrinomonadaceae bacterium]
MRRLVLTLVEKFDCITYSSCEGHPQMQAGGVPSLRHVGIIPRDAGEYDELLHCFRRAVDACRRLAARRSANVSVVERILSSENIALPCFEILFEREGAGWAAYFSHLEGVYELFIEHLVEEAHARVVQG